MSQSLKPNLQVVIDKRILPVIGVLAGLVVAMIWLSQKGWLPGRGLFFPQEQLAETLNLDNSTKIEAVRVGKLETGEMVLTDQGGLTLYINTSEKEFKSTCYDECAAKWRPLVVSSGEQVAGPQFSVVVREDDSLQAAFGGFPLYTYYKDEKQGNYFGDQVEGVWSMAALQLIEAEPSPLPISPPPIPNLLNPINENLDL